MLPGRYIFYMVFKNQQLSKVKKQDSNEFVDTWDGLWGSTSSHERPLDLKKSDNVVKKTNSNASNDTQTVIRLEVS